MSECKKCGKETKEEAKYCHACGGDLSKSGDSLHDKKVRVTGPERTWVKPAMILAAVVLVVVGGLLFKESRAERMGANPAFQPKRDASARLTNAVPVVAQGNDVRIPLNTVADGNAHFFAYVSGGKTITFFVVKAADGSIRTAFDACMACNHAKLGYRQQGGLVACNNCGMGFSPADIGKASGGCSPIPLLMRIDGQTLVFKTKDLDSGVRYF
jgi:uncharacterized membrane protein